MTARQTAERMTVATHWGSYEAELAEGRLSGLRPLAEDPDPSRIGAGLAAAATGPLRIARPMVREGWLRHGPGHGRRGAERFVAVDWERALDLVAGELERVRQQHGNDAIFAGSYGWASAGRFHHAQSQMRRFLNLIGGFARSVNAYSHAAAEVIMPYVAGNFFALQTQHHDWPTIAAHGELVVMFGGMPLKNAQVNSGGTARHNTRDGLRACREAGVEFVNIGPVRDDAADFLGAAWLCPRPNSDVALMLGLAHTLFAEGLHDEGFLARYCTGFERFRPYLTGEADGQPKDAAWAAAITGLDAGTIRALARRMAGKRTLITLAWSLQRADHGEQPYWMAVTLAAMLGQIGLPGGGFGYGYGAVSAIGDHTARLTWPSLPQGENPVDRP
ncbi:MAG TPA: molybdopterin-dependent oxidoreductase, partial [Alphaproteobacteria bacterium]|nr:molybdopterin-dependent oxidoreductase [Alphaproteobacteria bacterium]